MRRHPLIAALGLVVPLVVGCATSSPSMAPVGPETIEVTVSAGGEALTFDPDVIEVAGGRDVTVTFENRASLPHNLVFTGTVSGGTRTIVTPGGTDRFVITAPATGTHPFVCTIHEGMAGSLVVGDPP